MPLVALVVKPNIESLRHADRRDLRMVLPSPVGPCQEVLLLGGLTTHLPSYFSAALAACRLMHPALGLA